MQPQALEFNNSELVFVDEKDACSFGTNLGTVSPSVTVSEILLGPLALSLFIPLF